MVFTFYMLSGYGLHAVGLELDAIAAVVIGGTLLTGGVGYVAGTLFGVLMLGIIQTLIAFDGTFSSWWTRIVDRRAAVRCSACCSGCSRGARGPGHDGGSRSAACLDGSPMPSLCAGRTGRPAGGNHDFGRHSAGPDPARSGQAHSSGAGACRTLTGYFEDTSYVGQLVGRFGNRIAGAGIRTRRPDLQTDRQQPPNTLHGGDVGFGKYVWTVLGAGGGKNSYVKLGHRSPAGHQWISRATSMSAR